MPEPLMLQPEKFKKIVANLAGLEQELMKQIAALEEMSAPPTFTALMLPLEEIINHLDTIYWAAEQLNNLNNSKETRLTFKNVVTAYERIKTRMYQSTRLYELMKRLEAATEYQDLDQEQKTLLNMWIDKAERQGTHFDSETRQKFNGLLRELNHLSSEYNENIRYAKRTLKIRFDDTVDTKGIPDELLERARVNANAPNNVGFSFDLSITTILALLTNAEDRAIREKTYKVFQTYASEFDDTDGSHDNGEVIKWILKYRQELANLFNKKHFLDLTAYKRSLDDKQINEILEHIGALLKTPYANEIKQLEALAKELGIESIEPWDMWYLRDKLRERTFQFNEEATRSFFELHHTLNCIFETVGDLYQLEFIPFEVNNSWHEDVLGFKIIDKSSQVCGTIYLDLFERPNKTEAGYASQVQTRFASARSELQESACVVSTDFNPKNSNGEAFLSISEVKDLLHELGHALHYSVGMTHYPSTGDSDNYKCDTIEVPSILLEYLLRNPGFLKKLARNHDTSESFSDEQVEQFLKSQSFGMAEVMLTQMIYSLYDIAIHQSSVDNFHELFNELRAKFLPLESWRDSRRPNTFDHYFEIGSFEQGYAGIYSAYPIGDIVAASLFKELSDNPEKWLLLKEKFLRQGACGGSYSDIQHLIGYQVDGTAYLETTCNLVTDKPFTDEGFGFFKGKSVEQREVNNNEDNQQKRL
ncbi:M3 family metallopeptidase [Legionella shakespearei]|nr:M3 family metallopeptidase [Legionella shakespearei]